MKNIKKLIVATSLFTGSLAFAQAPEKMSYQAVIRDASNNLVSNHVVGMKISLLQGSVAGTVQYVETQNPTTNANGLASVEVGAGSVVSGNVSVIDWGTSTWFIKTEIDPTGGTNYTITSISQLLSVPYALYSKTSEKTKAVYGDPNYIPVYDATGERLVSSNIYQSNTGKIGINNPAPNYDFDVIVNTGVNFKANQDTQLVNIDSNTRSFLAFSSQGLARWGLWFNRLNNSEISFYNYMSGTEAFTISGTTDITTIKTLKIGTNGAPLGQYDFGNVTVGNSAIQKKKITLTFHYPFTTTNYRVNVTPINDVTFDDVFAVSVTNKTLTSCEIVVYRVDGTSWGQNLTLDYMISTMDN